ncbi:unnamed protein product [Adineta steineri]|uniref:carbonic anhydrase n=1 Tax=Adineta steineri TaxID=433720 RepID=A0A818SIQ6_9BILA|nr:unnamed protein product [Adineta steineri]
MFAHFKTIFILILINKCLASDWDYLEHGPDVWSEHYPLCGGERQSPINIKTACTIYQPFDQFILTPDHITENNFIAKYNGHTISSDTNNKNLALQGGNLTGTFYFDSFHLHWGPNHNVGSEHQINGLKSAGESHFVYRNALTNERAVLSFLMETRLTKSFRSNNKNDFYDTKSESEWKKFFDVAQKLTHENDSASIDLSLNSLMGNNRNEYWRYAGSLTTPPCTENVIWTIFKEPIVLLDYEFNSFRHELFFESFRGPQPLYYRQVYRTFRDEIQSKIPDENCCISTKSMGNSMIFNNKINSIYFFAAFLILSTIF